MKTQTPETLNPSLAATVLLLGLLRAQPSSAVTILDPFTNAANWGPPYAAPNKSLSISGGAMNYTASVSDSGGVALPRIASDLPGNTNVLLQTQDWSLKADVHLATFALTQLGQFCDLELGVGKTGDWTNTHVVFEFGRETNGPTHTGFDIQDGVKINGQGVAWENKLFNHWNLPSGDVSLRLDYSAANHAITYYFDADGAANGYNWVSQGTANLASGVFNLNLSPTDTFTIVLAGGAALQTVSAGQAYLANLQIVVDQAPVVATGVATNITDISAMLTGTVNPKGLPTTAWFEYGLTTNYGSTVAVTLSPNNGMVMQAVSTILSGLTSGATYHYRLAAFSSGGFTVTSDAIFTTLRIPYMYTTNNGAITIARYKEAPLEVPIPSEIHGLPVTSIGYRAFYNYYYSFPSNLIPTSVTNIDIEAFRGCEVMTNIDIPSSVLALGDYAFAECVSLRNITLHYGLASIGLGAFFQCTSLMNVPIPDSVTSLGDGAFYWCESLTNLAIPNGVTNPCSSVCYSCANLVAVSVGSGVPSIGDWSFYNCKKLTTVTIPSSVGSIGSSAFNACSSLTRVMVGAGVTNIADWAFAGCTSLTSAYFQGNAPALGNNVFYTDTKAVVYYLPGTSGWDQWVSPPPAVLWNPTPLTTDANFGVRSNRFGFNITGTPNIPIIVEASTNVTGGPWVAVQNGTLVNGLIYFSDDQWTNSPKRFYRIRSP